MSQMKPKKPLPAFFRFKARVYEALKAEHASKGSKELLTIVSKEYEKLSQKDKDKLTEEYKVEYEDYRRDLAEWEKAHPEQTSRKQKTQSKLRERSSTSKGKRLKAKDRSESRSLCKDMAKDRSEQSQSLCKDKAKDRKESPPKEHKGRSKSHIRRNDNEGRVIIILNFAGHRVGQILQNLNEEIDRYF